MSEDVRAVIREYVTGSSFLRRPGEIGDVTPLAVYGILDSVAVLELVLFLEDRFGIEFSTLDFDRRQLETIERIEELVREKLAHKSEGGEGPGGGG